MKPVLDGFAVVTATTSMERAHDCVSSWINRGVYDWPLHVIQNGDGRNGPHLGVVPAFAKGVAQALRDGATIICTLHDDLLIEEDGWDTKVHRWFTQHPACGLLGFGGGTGLGDANIYQTAYSPHQLARQGFVSNMRDAEAHGVRSLAPVQVAALDGFSLIGTRAFWQGRINGAHQLPDARNLFQRLADLGMTHHFQDGSMGCYAKRHGWEVWMLPIAVHHFGGRTAVGDPGYQAWAEGVVPGGDRTFWELSHSLGYEHFKDVLPIRVK